MSGKRSLFARRFSDGLTKSHKDVPAESALLKRRLSGSSFRKVTQTMFIVVTRVENRFARSALNALYAYAFFIIVSLNLVVIVAY